MLKRLRRFALNYLATLCFAWFAVTFYTELSPYHTRLLNSQGTFVIGNWRLSLHSHALLWGLFWFYAVALIPYYALQPRIKSKAGLLVRALWYGMRRGEMPKSWPVRQAALSLGLKFFFAPLMINWLFAHVIGMHQQYSGVRAYWIGHEFRVLFDAHLFWFLFQIILFADVLMFTFGYLIEMPALRNRIRSVDPTLFGWMVCLLCYPPFNGWVGDVFAWRSTDFPRFGPDWLHYSMNVSLLALMAIYSWASIALGLKASNLTNRGLVARGPYRFVRHPAYFCKNMAWWLGLTPALILATQRGWREVLVVLIGMSIWTLLYFLRAVTEERHLLRGHIGYAAYMQQVKYRFIPGVI